MHADKPVGQASRPVVFAFGGMTGQEACPTKRGFSLLEVLVAVAVLGTAVAAVSSVLSNSLRNIERAEDYQRVTLLARSQMHELLALPSWKDGQSWNGNWNRESRWRAKVERVPQVQQGGRDFMRLVLVASWTTTRGEKTVTYETARLQLRRLNE